MATGLIIILNLFFIFFSYWLYLRLSRKIEDTNLKVDKFDRQWISILEKVEKKISTSQSDVGEITKEFKNFQSKFLEFDEKVEKITKSLFKKSK